MLLYDLTSTYFESDPALEPEDKRKFGYSRDKRNDCVQVIIALVVTPEGFPIAYEVLAGNTAVTSQTISGNGKQIEPGTGEKVSGRKLRIWVGCRAGNG